MNARIALLLLALPTLANAAPVMKPGMWALTMTVYGEGRQRAMKPVEQCISQADIDDDTRTLPRPAGACTLSNVQRADDNTIYDLACQNGAVIAQGRAQVRFEADKYEGSVVMSMSEHGSPAQLTALRIYARRVGDCTK
jgi:hypothetical protein